MASSSDLPDSVECATTASPAWIAFLVGPNGTILSFLWGFSEGTLFFVVPDVFLSLVAAVSPRRVWRHILSAVLGAVCAGAVMYAWAQENSMQAHEIVSKVPFIHKRMFEDVRNGYERRGMTAVFLGPLSGIPYKIYAIDAPSHFGLVEFASATAPARASRFILVSLFFAAIAHCLRKKWRKTPQQLVVIHAVVWILFYSFYWGRIALK